MRRNNYYISVYALLMLSLFGCDSAHEVRTYTEITHEAKGDKVTDPHAGLDMRMMPGMMPGMQTDDPQVQKMLDQSVAAVDLKWDVPNGWNESPGSGMRLATFASTEEDAITCSVISLGGVVGGEEANVQRWARQIQIPLEGEALSAFVSRQQAITSDSGVVSRVYDFRELQANQSESSASMMAAIVTLQDKTVFFKMTGTLNAINQNASAFESLLKSIVVP